MPNLYSLNPLPHHLSHVNVSNAFKNEKYSYLYRQLSFERLTSLQLSLCNLFLICNFSFLFRRIAVFFATRFTTHKRGRRISTGHGWSNFYSSNECSGTYTTSCACVCTSSNSAESSQPHVASTHIPASCK